MTCYTNTVLQAEIVPLKWEALILELDHCTRAIQPILKFANPRVFKRKALAWKWCRSAEEDGPFDDWIKSDQVQFCCPDICGIRQNSGVAFSLYR